MLGAWDALKEKLIRYLLNQYLGPYFKNFNVDKFSLGFSGTGGLKDVQVNCESMNLLLGEGNVPLEIVEGHVESIGISVPWYHFRNQSCQVDINGLYLHVQPRARSDNERHADESMLSSMAPSVLAEDFRKNVEFPEGMDQGEAMSAIRNVEDTITSVFFGVRFHLQNTVIRLEPHKDTSGLEFGAALELHIKSLQILAGEKQSSESDTETDPESEGNRCLRKLVVLEGVKVFLDCFQKLSPFQSLNSEKVEEERHLIRIAEFNGVQEIHARIKLDEVEPGPKVHLDLRFDTLLALLTPMQIQIFEWICKEFVDPSSADFPVHHPMCQSWIRPGINQGWTSSVDSFEKEEKFSSLLTPGSVSQTIFENEPLNLISSDSKIKFEDSSDKDRGVVAEVCAKFKMVAVVLLHTNILALNSRRGIVPSSVQELHLYVERFFERFKTDSYLSNTEEVSSVLQAASFGKSHLQLLISGIHSQSTVSKENAASVTEGYLSFGNLELNEFLSQENLAPLSCKSRLNKIFYSLPGLDSKIDFTFSKPTANSMEAALRFGLQKFGSEIDISIADRLHLVLNPESIYTKALSHQQSRETILKLSLKFSLEELDLNIRIPVQSKETYWVQDLQEDSIALSLQHLLLKSEIDSKQQVFQAELKLAEGSLGYKANAFVNSVTLFTTAASSPDFLGISILLYPQEESALMDRAEVEFFKNFGERVILGTDEEIQEIKTKFGEKVHLHVSCNLDSVLVSIPSKDLLESMSKVLERLSSWKPQAPVRSTYSIPEHIPQPFLFSEQTPSTQYDSDDGTFYSVVGDHGDLPSVIPPSFSHTSAKAFLNQTELVLDVQIANVAVSVLTPFKNFANKFVQGSHGQITLAAKNLNLFFVSKYKGNPSLDYLYLRCEEISVLHSDLQREEFLMLDDPRLKTIMTPSHPDIQSYCASLSQSLSKSPAMLAVALILEKESATVYLGLQNATFNHWNALPNRDIFSQLADFVGTDQDQTESSFLLNALHVNVSNVTVTYAPISDQLTTRALFLLEQTSILLHAEPSKSTILQLLVQNAELLLTNRKESCDVQKDYVKILDIDLFNLLLKICNSTVLQAGGPEIDLEINSGSVVNIAACSDTLKLLLDLALHVSNDGDLLDLEDYAGLKSLQDSEDFPAPVRGLEGEDFSSEIFRFGMNDAMKSFTQSSSASPMDPSYSINLKGEDAVLPSLGSSFTKSPRLYPDLAFAEESFDFVDDYFGDVSKIEEGRKDFFKAPQNYPNPLKRFALNHPSLHLSLFGGSDFGTGRNSEVLVEFIVEKMKYQHDIYPEDSRQASRQVLTLHRLEVTDKVKTSRFKKVLSLDMPADALKKENPCMVVLIADHVRPEEKIKLEECSLEIQVQPLQITLDQETLTFLIQFTERLVPVSSSDSDLLKKTSELDQEENTVVFNSGGGVDIQGAEGTGGASEEVSSSQRGRNGNRRPKVYFKEIKFSPEVPIRLDYRGNLTFDFVSPSMNWLTSFLMGIGTLDNAKIKLVALKNDRGVLGVESVLNYFTNEWAADISKHQLPGILKGVDILLPANSFVQLYQGAKDLFVLPVEQYQKDGNLMYGLQLGLTSFSSSTIDALLQLTNRLVQAVQATAEVTYDIVSSGQSIEQERQASALRSHPAGIVDGVTNAYTAIVDGVGGTATNFVTAASEGHASKGIPGAIGGVLREIPPAVVKPVIIAAEATSNVIEGVKAQIHPSLKMEFDEKRKK